MVQTERETGALRGQFARQVTVQASAAAQAESARAQAEQLSRKLAAARAEVCAGIRPGCSPLSALCLPSSTIMQSWKPPVSRRGSSWNRPMPGQKRLKPPAAEPKPPLQPYSRLPRKTPAQPDTIPETVLQCEAVEEQPAPETEELLCAPEQALPPGPAQSAWQPETRLEQMAAELMGWFDAMMPQE